MDSDKKKKDDPKSGGLTYSKIAYAVLYGERKAANPSLTIEQFNASLFALVTPEGQAKEREKLKGKQ